jgi:hypothetical protein
LTASLTISLPIICPMPEIPFIAIAAFAAGAAPNNIFLALKIKKNMKKYVFLLD